MENNKIYTVININKQENCINNMASYDNLEQAKARAIVWSYQMIEFDNLWISLEDLQKKWYMDSPCIARDFTDENWLYVFDWEDVVRIEVVQNTLYTNLQ